LIFGAGGARSTLFFPLPLGRPGRLFNGVEESPTPTLLALKVLAISCTDDASGWPPMASDAPGRELSIVWTTWQHKVGMRMQKRGKCDGGMNIGRAQLGHSNHNERVDENMVTKNYDKQIRKAENAEKILGII